MPGRALIGVAATGLALFGIVQLALGHPEHVSPLPRGGHTPTQVNPTARRVVEQFLDACVRGRADPRGHQGGR